MCERKMLAWWTWNRHWQWTKILTDAIMRWWWADVECESWIDIDTRPNRPISRMKAHRPPAFSRSYSEQIPYWHWHISTKAWRKLSIWHAVIIFELFAHSVIFKLKRMCFGNNLFPASSPTQYGPDHSVCKLIIYRCYFVVYPTPNASTERILHIAICDPFQLLFYSVSMLTIVRHRQCVKCEESECYYKWSARVQERRSNAIRWISGKINVCSSSLPSKL